MQNTLQALCNNIQWFDSQFHTPLAEKSFAWTMMIAYEENYLTTMNAKRTKEAAADAYTSSVCFQLINWGNNQVMR